MKTERFILQPYKTPASRGTCPKCHKQRCFSRYIDTEGIVSFPAEVGRCNHEHSCGYHYPPREYFKDHPDEKYDLKTEDNSRTTAMPEKPAVEPYYFDEELMRRTEAFYEYNNLSLFLRAKLGADVALAAARRYHLGTSKHWPGATVYWQVDVCGRVRAGKIMLYDPLTGTRAKDVQHHVTWLHALMGIDRERIHQCFFGEHLLREEKDKPIALVESEKTAMIASCLIPDYVWLATGGKDGMFSRGDFSLFQGRPVVLFPDLGMLGNWQEKARILNVHGANASVYDFLEQRATAEEREAGLDIADYLLREPSPSEILQSMIDKNSSVALLMEKFDLELVKEPLDKQPDGCLIQS